MDWQSRFQAELDKAEQARIRGNEGQARVCARRAAGIAAREYFDRQGRTLHTTSAYDLLNILLEDPALPNSLHRSAENLVLRVNEKFKLPLEVDLILEARNLCRGLLNTE